MTLTVSELGEVIIAARNRILICSPCGAVLEMLLIPGNCKSLAVSRSGDVYACGGKIHVFPRSAFHKTLT